MIIECLLLDGSLSTHDVFTFVVCVSAAACISEEMNVDLCWHRVIFRVKGRAQIKAHFVGEINMQSLSGHFLIRQLVPVVLF